MINDMSRYLGLLGKRDPNRRAHIQSRLNVIFIELLTYSINKMNHLIVHVMMAKNVFFSGTGPCYKNINNAAEKNISVVSRVNEYIRAYIYIA